MATVAKAILSVWFWKFGLPAQIHTDVEKSLSTNSHKNFTNSWTSSTPRQLQPVA